MREKSCGTVTFTKIDGEIKYLLTRTDYGVYGFAKGHVEDGESERQTAVRETWEETSIKPKIVNGFRKTIQYKLKNGNDKTVVFYLGYFENQTPKHNEGFENMTAEELKKMGLNDSMIHVDFMIGSEDLNITAHTRDGKDVAIFKDGNWAF